jgi:alanyl-tRNA synthetase
MRRAMRHAQLLGADSPLMWRLVPTLVREMGQAYPELSRAEALITETLRLEESRFRNTLERGLSILEEESRNLRMGDRLKGETAFTLYDTYGFPLDLTEDALRPRGIAVDLDGFNRAMTEQREKARAAWVGSGDSATEAVWFAVRQKVGATEFLGYETETAEGWHWRWCVMARKSMRSAPGRAVQSFSTRPRSMPRRAVRLAISVR